MSRLFSFRKPDFDSRRNFTTEEGAKINFIERVIRHKDLNHGVKLSSEIDDDSEPTGNATVCAKKSSVMDEIRAAQKSPKPPAKSKPEQNKKKQDPDL